MPTFCRHNRFIERCPICSKTLPGSAPRGGAGRATGSASRTRRAPARATPAPAGSRPARRPAAHAESVRVHREQREADDGYRCALVPGLRASADAQRLAGELAFASGRLAALAAQPPGVYGEARALAPRDIEAATWMCFLLAYLCPLEGADPFAGVRAALAAGVCEPFEVNELPLGPRSAHDASRGWQAPGAYCRWASQAGGQAAAFAGDPSWTPQRRFARVFERLAVGGFARAGRYELLVVLGRLGVFELRADSLALAGAGAAGSDQTMLAAKRVFAIGDPLLLERRARALAQAAAVPLEALDLALSNWISAGRAHMGFGEEVTDEEAFARASRVLGL